MRVRDAMTPAVVTVSPSQSLRDAARMMIERHVGAAIVVDAMLPGPGILTERDIMGAVADGVDLDSATVEDRMTFEARTSGPDWDLQTAGTAMIDGKFRHLIVVGDDGGLAGIVSMRDIVRAHVGKSRTDGVIPEVTGRAVHHSPVIATTG